MGHFARRVGSIAMSIAVVLGLAGAALAQQTKGRKTSLPGDNLTFRPTVIILRGNHQGSGTVIASVPGETLVLTAAHVLEGDAPVIVEVHRYNLGLENRREATGWPKKIPAKVVALDRAADVGVLKIGGFEAMPYVAKVAAVAGEPDRGTVVLSVGIDRGAKLSSWTTEILDHAVIDLYKTGVERPFMLTEKPPEHGRSGGGLFRPDGTVVGVCVGRVEIIKGRRFGVFTSTASVQKVLRENHLDAAVARSLARRLPRSKSVERTNTSVPAPMPPSPTPLPPRAGTPE
jgi:S1-C subfamily serine protease